MSVTAKTPGMIRIIAALDLEEMAREAAMQYLSDTGQMMDRIAALEAQVKAADGLADFAQAVVDRWDSRDWRSGHTFDFIEAQRKSLATYRAAKEASHE